MKRILTTPINAGEMDSINIGDVIYLNGTIVTCRDVGHRRLIEQNITLPVSLQDCAIFHAGPIVRKTSEGNYEMVSIGPTTSMRMEKFEKEFIKRTGVRVIVGKGGMGADTAEGCKLYKAIHCVFPAGCAVLAASAVEEITDVQWTELGMPESLWIMRVKELGPLIVSIDTRGNNLFENKKAIYNERKKAVLEQITPRIKFIK